MNEFYFTQILAIPFFQRLRILQRTISSKITVSKNTTNEDRFSFSVETKISADSMLRSKQFQPWNYYYVCWALELINVPKSELKVKHHNGIFWLWLDFALEWQRQLTLKRNEPMGGFAYGTFVNPLIVRPLNDRRYLPTNLLPFGSVTRSSSEMKAKTRLVQLTMINRFKSVRDDIFGPVRKYSNFDG